MQEPADIDLFEPLAVVVKGSPVRGILVPAEIRMAITVGARAAIVRRPLCLADHRGQVDVIFYPLRLLLDVCPAVGGLAVPEVVEGHRVDVRHVGVFLDTLTHIAKPAAVAVAHNVRAVPVFTDSHRDTKAGEPAAQFAQVGRQVVTVHTVTDRLRAKLDRVHDIRCNGGATDSIVECLLGVPPLVL